MSGMKATQAALKLLSEASGGPDTGTRRLQNAPAARFEIEPFAEVAFAELQDYPLAPVGVCLNPGCSRSFDPPRSWSLYCSEKCRDLDSAEFRKVGHKLAPALLAWRMGKSEAHDRALRALSSKGRSYVTTSMTEWLNDRRRRIALAKE